jgi:hypothetical protein
MILPPMPSPLLRRQPFDLPLTLNASVAESIMQAIYPALPKLDLSRREAIATPIGWHGNIFRVGKFIH